MNVKVTLASMTLYALAYLVLFITWAWLVFSHVSDAAALVSYIQITLGSLTGHVFTIINPVSPRFPVATQGDVPVSAPNVHPNAAPNATP